MTHSKSNLIHALECLNRLQYPSDLTFAYDGSEIAAAVRPACREAEQSYQSRIWKFALDGASTQLTYGPNGDYTPRFSPVDRRLAFASDRTTMGKADLFILEDGIVHPLGEIPGTIENIRWTNEGTALIALAADRGLDGGATNGAVRIWWGGTEDPAVTNPINARRRLYRVDARTGKTTEVGPPHHTVWDFDLLGGNGAVALISGDSSERGWYHSKLARLSFDDRSYEILYEPKWQLQGLAVAPSGDRIAFVEGWSSDRGLVAGVVQVMDVATREVTKLVAAEQSNISAVHCRDDKSLWVAGWSRLGCTYGILLMDGSFEWLEREDAVVGPTSFLASITPAPDGAAFAGVREAVGEPPEIVYRSSHKSRWNPVSKLNVAVAKEYPEYPEVRHIRWAGKDGLKLEALALLPQNRKPGPLPMVVDIHGGPTWSTKYAFDPGFALPYAAAGYAVFAPNYRGNTGWGQPFSQLNIGDPGGAEFDDILAGIDQCIAEGFADPQRLGVTGASYGGYLTAWAVAMTNRFKAAVMVSGIANQWSCHYTCNHDFSEFIVGGPLKEDKFRKLAIERSPLFRLDTPTTPTLIIHGIEDRCTPLGQGQEFYSALVERGVEAELVAYPREGHGFQERDHQQDAWQRTLAWFDRYLRPGQ